LIYLLPYYISSPLKFQVVFRTEDPALAGS
jgi:hypothetical protein